MASKHQRSMHQQVGTELPAATRCICRVAVIFLCRSSPVPRGNMKSHSRRRMMFAKTQEPAARGRKTLAQLNCTRTRRRLASRTDVITEDIKRVAAQLGHAAVFDAIGPQKRNGLEGASSKPFLIK